MKLVITISRRYGTGASQIAGELSEQLGIPVYDKTHVEEKCAVIPMIQRQQLLRNWL